MENELDSKGAVSFKIPSKGKIDEWTKQIAMYAGDNLSMYNSFEVRTRSRDMQINVDLYNGKLHAQDMKAFVNPVNLQTIDATRELKHYPQAAKLIDLLVGEEINGIFEPMVETVNNVGIEEKEAMKKAYISSEIDRITQEYGEDEEAIAAETKKLMRHLKYTYKDLKEIKSTALLQDYDKQLNFKDIFVEGYRRVFLTGGEVYEIDVIHGKATLRPVNLINMRVYGMGRSNRIEDADMTVIEEHYPPGYLIDRYGDELSNFDVERILNYQATDSFQKFDQSYGDVTYQYKYAADGLIGSEYSDSLIDANGGLRHLRIRWKGFLQYKKVKYRDPDTGVENIKTRSNNYKLQPGEVLDSKFWAVQWWVATLIGYDIVVDARPMPIQYNRLGEPMSGHPGLVGQFYNVNEEKTVPMMSKLKSLQYLYDVTADNMITAMAKNIGPILEMDLAKKPANWDTKQWLHYITKYNVKFTDSFKEINKGPSKGQLAGNLAVGKDSVMEVSFGNYIQQLVSMMQYIEQAMGNLVGITPQRMGSVSNRETVGGVERATSQSSHITEWYSYIHENVKLRTLNVFMEAAKHALKDNPKKLSTMMTSGMRKILEVTEDDFVDIDMGVYVTDSKRAHQNKQFLEQAAQAYMQNGGDFAFAFKIMFSESMAEKRRLIEIDQEEKKEQMDQQRQEEMQAMQAQTEAEQKEKQDDRDLEKYKADLNAMVQIKLEEMKQQGAAAGMAVDAELSMAELESKMLQMQNTMQSDREKREVDREKIQADKAKAQTSASA